VIILDATTRSLEVVLSGAITTNQLPVVASYVDVTTTTYVPGATPTVTNSTTPVTIAAAPGASTQRQVKMITVRNADTVSATVTINYNDNATLRALAKFTLAVDDLLVYTDGEGFRVFSSAGALKATIDLADDYVTFAKMQNISTDTLIGRDTAGTGSPEEISLSSGLEFSGSQSIRMKTDQRTRTITFIIDGGGSTITTGIKGDLEIPFACTITAATLLADQSGSIVIDIWKDTYANYPPTDADSITSAAPPTISTATKSQDTTLTGWTTSITAGDTLRFNVDSITTCTRVTLSLKVTVA
jgi:hypothetical protein